jgi:hypothetical protein
LRGDAPADVIVMVLVCTGGPGSDGAVGDSEHAPMAIAAATASAVTAFLRIVIQRIPRVRS